MDRNESAELETSFDDLEQKKYDFRSPLDRTTEYWYNLGLPLGVAQTLAFGRVYNLDQLRNKTRKELFAIPGFRERALSQCEDLIGRKLPSSRVSPTLEFWLSQGLSRRGAAALQRANVHSLGHLVVLGRKRLLQIQGFGPRDLKKCEALLGLGVPIGPWREMGLPVRIADALDAAGIHTLEKLGAMTRDEFLLIEGLGEAALRRCEALLGRSLPNPLEDWKKRKRGGLRWEITARKLVRARIFSPQELRQKTDDELLQAGLDREEIKKARRVRR